MDSAQQKQQLRKELLARRARLTDEQYETYSTQICNQLLQLPAYKQAKVVHCYISMNKRREVNTHLLLKQMHDEGKEVVVPVTQIDDGTLWHVELRDFNQLKENRWGVLEPAEGRKVSVSELEMVIVPMVAGDPQKNRIGYGKGFYDRFLQQINCPKIGFLFEDCLVEQLPVESFDVPLDLLITEQQIVR